MHLAAKLNKKNKFFYLKVRSHIKTLNEQKLLCVWKGLFPPQRVALYAKVLLFLSTLLFKTVKNFSVKSGALRREQPLSYTE